MEEVTKKVEEKIESYQSRPREVEALFYDGTNIDKVKKFTGAKVDVSPVNKETVQVFAETPNATVIGVGMWIVKEGDVFTLYEDEDFTRLFEKVEKQPE
jgi:hypothetical protein